MKEAHRSVSLVLLPLLCLAFSGSAEQAYRLHNGDIGMVQAEDLSHGAVWVKETDKDGYSGSGYLRYVGPERHGSDANEEYVDPDGRYQGTESDWVTYPVLIEKAGVYFMQAKVYHTTKFPDLHGHDCTVWTHAKEWGYPVNYSHGNTLNNSANNFAYLGYGPAGWVDGDEFAQLGAVSFTVGTSEAPCVLTFYVAGRDQNFIVDKIQIYRRIGPPSLKHDAYPPNYQSDGAALATLVDTDAPFYGQSTVRRMTPEALSVAQSRPPAPSGALSLLGRMLQSNPAGTVPANLVVLQRQGASAWQIRARIGENQGAVR